ncbi:hypothetical protein BT67DRAFT_164386 [Trichocladium antarcticum]|uniref:Uncharacterized protein n=1 Tax=Trichocladium antarcticum TaxID=1450529 RepID=A0AAN6ZAL3_9PEZI|nr:hypothetical protein BT67DRAFT_164386 [Trichocladium antarcticum]
MQREKRQGEYGTNRMLHAEKSKQGKDKEATCFLYLQYITRSLPDKAIWAELGCCQMGWCYAMHRAHGWQGTGGGGAGAGMEAMSAIPCHAMPNLPQRPGPGCNPPPCLSAIARKDKYIMHVPSSTSDLAQGRLGWALAGRAIRDAEVAEVVTRLPIEANAGCSTANACQQKMLQKCY